MVVIEMDDNIRLGKRRKNSLKKARKGTMY